MLKNMGRPGYEAKLCCQEREPFIISDHLPLSWIYAYYAVCTGEPDKDIQRQRPSGICQEAARLRHSNCRHLVSEQTHHFCTSGHPRGIPPHTLPRQHPDQSTTRGTFGIDQPHGVRAGQNEEDLNRSFG